jgi:UDPglucose--hexose-1-phosphate uridylyltransferase
VHLHWRLRIVPQQTVPGGFELASGLAINPSLPEEDAAILRSFGRRTIET